MMWPSNDARTVLGETTSNTTIALRELGYYAGKVDNDFTADLAHAIEEFQRKSGMRQVDGYIGQLTLREMMRQFKSAGTNEPSE